MNLITGRAGAAHITPRQDAMWHQGLIEMESCIFDAYENFAAEIITNNEVRIRSGVGMLQGRFFCIEPNTYDSAEIANGNQGEERIDLIVARIAVDASANTQSASIEVIQGTPAAENPTAPEAVTGDLDAGDLIADYPLAEVHISSINITSVENAFNAGWLSLPQTRQNINFIGTNPISSVAEDTPATWVALGTGVCSYNTNAITDQPAQYGSIISAVAVDSVTQIWVSAGTGGGMYYRRGNMNGWQTTWKRVLDENSGVQMVTVWENASPTSEFASQTINTTPADYDYVMVVFQAKTDNVRRTIAFSEVGVFGEALIVGNIDNSTTLLYILRRFNLRANGELEFSNTYFKQSSNSTTNERLIPLKVIGIKGVQ